MSVAGIKCKDAKKVMIMSQTVELLGRPRSG